MFAKHSTGHRLQTTLKTVSIAIGFILTVGLLMRLFVGFPEKASKLQIPLFLRSDTDIWSASLPLRHDPEWRAWLTQSGIHVSAIVFYGRRAFVRVLDAYLKRNLVSAGGLLEEVSTALTLRAYAVMLKQESIALLPSGRMGRSHR